MRLSFFIAGTAAAFVGAFALPSTYVLHEKREYLSSVWAKRARMDGQDTLPIRVGLKQRNLEKGYEKLMGVSHPDSPNFAKHWTSEDVTSFFSPSDDSVSIVKDWLKSSGIDKSRITHTDNKAWLAFDATVEEAENLLHTKYYTYEHSTSGHIDVSYDEYHVPKNIQQHIDYITPGLKLLAPKFVTKRTGNREQKFRSSTGNFAQRQFILPPNSTTTPPLLKACDTAITPSCVAALYNIPPGTRADPENAMGVFELDGSYSPQDLDRFFANFARHIPNGTRPTSVFINNAQASGPATAAGEESNLDIQLAYPILWPQGIVFYQVGVDDQHNKTFSTAAFNVFLEALDGSYCTYCEHGECGDAVKGDLDPVPLDPLHNGSEDRLQCGIFKPTNVISVSYGGQEADLPLLYQQRQCNEYMKLGLQGHSVIYSSGDSGVAGPNTNNALHGCLGFNGSVFSPGWPVSCPYITTVGATTVYAGRTVFDPESGVVDPTQTLQDHPYSSGGGFSNIYGMPEYQATAVSSYFTNHNPSYPSYTTEYGTGIYNRTGRGYPDVAANGEHTLIYNDGQPTLTGGTSASAPIFASIVNRINEERLAVNKTPIGFVNPTLYAHPYVLNDITTGMNPGCWTNGFAAVSGWDPVTGLGTPNFPKMLALFMSLP